MILTCSARSQCSGSVRWAGVCLEAESPENLHYHTNLLRKAAYGGRARYAHGVLGEPCKTRGVQGVEDPTRSCAAARPSALDRERLPPLSGSDYLTSASGCRGIKPPLKLSSHGTGRH